jgi:hypothetical protein
VRPVSKKNHEIDLAGLPVEMPDLDTLIDFNAEPDHVPIRDRFGVKTMARSCRQKSGRVVTFDLRKVKAAAECIERLPAPGEYVHMIVGQEFAGFDLLPAMLQLAGARKFGRLYLTTLGFSRDNLAQLETMLRAKQIDGRRLHILCGDFFRRADSGLWDIGRLLAKEWRFDFKSFRNHTKLILAELAGAFYVVEGSANLRSCHNLEQFTITRSEELFEFHQGWIRECLTFAKT